MSRKILCNFASFFTIAFCLILCRRAEHFSTRKFLFNLNARRTHFCDSHSTYRRAHDSKPDTFIHRHTIFQLNRSQRKNVNEELIEKRHPLSTSFERDERLERVR